MLASSLLFFARPGVGILYLWAGLLLAYGGWSVCVLAQTSWGARLSPDYDQRSRVYAWWQTANVSGLILVLLLPVVIARFTDAPGAGMRGMGAVVLVLIPLTVGFTALRLKEPPRGAGHMAGLADWLGLFRSSAVRRLLAADVVLGLVPGVAAALFLFYFEQMKGFRESASNALLLVYFIAALVGAPLWSRLADQIGKHTALGWAALFYLVGQAALFLIPNGHLPAAVAAAFVAGLP